ncbi:endonuclease VII domain-containing protein [Streptomyces sp. NBC_00076]|uniref:endonuclease VII domain-containing protein n=1 Tax=Streptomyces sp. NBC_00076 TaxID=2975642 RepID=UPI00386E6706
MRDPRLRDEDGNKQCRGCDSWLPEDAFSRNRRCSDGFAVYCGRCVRDEYLRRQYGITADQYDTMADAQSGVCAICKAPDPAGKGLAVDHDHACCPDPAKSCGACVRGLLCWPCNVGLGHLRDDPTILSAAATYLTAA